MPTGPLYCKALMTCVGLTATGLALGLSAAAAAATADKQTARETARYWGDGRWRMVRPPAPGWATLPGSVRMNARAGKRIYPIRNRRWIAGARSEVTSTTASGVSAASGSRALNPQATAMAAVPASRAARMSGEVSPT